MDRDDVQIGRVLTRREALALLGVSGAGLLAGQARWPPAAAAAQLPPCVVRPAQTLGPYFVDERLLRSDIRPDPSTGAMPAGALLELSFTVSRVGPDGCRPLPGAQVDLWQCDAAGVYSDVVDRAFNTQGQKFLRGHQITDDAGRVQFATIYPGWYPGRTVHIHFKIQTNPGSAARSEFVSQVYFDDAVTDRVHASAPYAAKGARSLRNDRDGIYRRGGRELMLHVTETPRGWAAPFEIGLEV